MKFQIKEHRHAESVIKNSTIYFYRLGQEALVWVSQGDVSLKSYDINCCDMSQQFFEQTMNSQIMSPV